MIFFFVYYSRLNKKILNINFFKNIKFSNCDGYYENKAKSEFLFYLFQLFLFAISKNKNKY